MIVSTSTSSITALANLIAEQTAKLERYHIENGLPAPSLDAGSEIFPPPQYPPEIALAREKILDATDELQARVYGSVPFLFRQILNRHNEQVSLHIISKFNICGAFPVGEEASYAEITKKCGLDENDTRRILNHAIANHIFISPRPGYVAHNGPSQALANSAGLRATLQHTVDNMVPSMNNLASALELYPYSQEPTETGFNVAFNSKDTFFDHISQSKDKADIFHQCMSFFSSGPGFETHHTVNGFDWAELAPGATVVDVGGSNGFMSKVLTATFPNLNCVVQDRPEGLGDAEPCRGVTFMVHDFFTEQPVKQADVYLLRCVLHDWSDAYCKKILRNLTSALGSKSKLIINDFCIPDMQPQASNAFRTLTCMDMAMKASLNGKERTKHEWIDLATKADSRFCLRSFTQSPESKLSLIVFDWDDVLGRQ